MSEIMVRERFLRSGKKVYEYSFEMASVDGKRKRKSKSGFTSKRDARIAGRKALSEYAKKSSIIIVAQRVSSIINAHQIVVLDEGKIAGIGKHNDLLRTCSVYQEIVKSQMDKDEIEKTVLLQQEVVTMKGGN